MEDDPAGRVALDCLFVGVDNSSMPPNSPAIESPTHGVVPTTADRLIAGAVVLAIGIGTLRLFAELWNSDAFAALGGQPGGWLGAIAIVVASTLFHEGLHVLGWRLAMRLPWSAFALRPTWRGMGIAAQPRVALDASALRAGLLLPALTLAAPAIVVGLSLGSGLALLWGQFFLLECYGDLVTLLALHRAPRR